MSLPRDAQELRGQLAAILRANRELGPGYEQIAIDQILEATGRRGETGRRAADSERPAAGSAWPLGRMLAGLLLAAVAALVLLPALGMAAATIFGLWPLLLLLLVLRGAWRWGRRAPWDLAGPHRRRWCQRYWC